MGLVFRTNLSSSFSSYKTREKKDKQIELKRDNSKRHDKIRQAKQSKKKTLRGLDTVLFRCHFYAGPNQGQHTSLFLIDRKKHLLTPLHPTNILSIFSDTQPNPVSCSSNFELPNHSTYLITVYSIRIHPSGISIPSTPIPSRLHFTNATIEQRTTNVHQQTMVSMNSTSNMGIEMTSVASCLNDVVPLLATATGTATSIPSSSPPAATTLPTLDQRAAYISQWRQSIASSSDSHVQNEVETATGTAHIQGIPEVKTEDVTHGISTALGHEIQNTTPNQTEAEAQDPTLTQRPSSSSSSASSSSSSLQQPEAPHLSQKGSNFSLHASGSSSRGRMEKQCLPLSSASSQTSGSRSPSPARLGAEQKKNESRAVGSEGEKVKQTQTQTSGGDKKQLAEKMVGECLHFCCCVYFIGPTRTRRNQKRTHSLTSSHPLTVALSLRI